ncbi:GNAT family N-acetyltransferase, partial [Streptomyces sp. NRRL S-15]
MTVLRLASPAPVGVPAPRPAAAPSGYRVSLATCQDDVRAAQRLRHLVFAGELGARLDSAEPGLDSDAFDAYCDHLLVRETATGEVVAT